MRPPSQEVPADPSPGQSGGLLGLPSIPVGELEVAICRQSFGLDNGHRSVQETFRLGPNSWVVVVGDVGGSGDELDGLVGLVGSTIRSASARHVLPSAVLSEVHRALGSLAASGAGRYQCAVAVGRVELDACGAWVTLSSAGHPRPMVVRQAGWVDVRAHASGPLGLRDADPGDDRVGLGPGDALVLCSEGITASRNADGEAFGDRVLPDVLVDCAGFSSDALAGRILAAAHEFRGNHPHGDGVLLVLRVPESVRNDGIDWVSRSTGISLAQLQLPGYPLGDEQPVGRRSQVDAPREAIIRLAPEPPSVPALRRILRRLLQSWRREEVSNGDIEVLLTEVATKVFSHTSSPVTVIVRLSGPMLRVEVGDGARGVPRRRRPGFEDLTGHGLALVEALASDWGVSTTPAGTMMWFEIPAAVPPLDPD